MRVPYASLVFAVVAVVFALAGCKRSANTAAAGDAGARPGSSARLAVAAAGSVTGPGVPRVRLSAPIAAATTRSGVTFVAGLDVARGVVLVLRLGAGDGDPAWTREVLSGVKWAPGVSLHVQTEADGVAVFWRGPRGGQSVKQAVVLRADGTARGNVVDIGALACATELGLTWVDATPKGDPHVRLQSGDAATVDLAVLPADREPELLCGPHHVFVSARGDDDVTLMVGGSDGNVVAPRLVLSRASDFPRDDEREHATYVVGDDFGIVRVGVAGGLSLREVHRGAVSPWKRLAAKLTPDDDLVALDADEKEILLVYTHDAGDACTGPLKGATSVHGLVIDRASFRVSTFELAPSECGKDVGPFSIGRAEGALVPVWAERTAHSGNVDTRTTAPITGFAFRRVALSGLGVLERRAQHADALVDAGCDGRACRLVALVRDPGSDGTAPAGIRLLPYR